MRHFRPGLSLFAISVFVAFLVSSPCCESAYAWRPSKAKVADLADENVRSMRQKAEDGLVAAQLVMAKWCFDGGVLSIDHSDAARWYEMAAKQGNVEAMLAVGKMLNEGDGVPKNARKGCEWYVAAARKGNAEAYYKLGRIFESGDGVATDKAKAIKLYGEAAKRGNADSAFRLAQIYDADSEAGENADKRDQYLALAAELGSDAAKEMQNQVRDRAMESQWSSDVAVDEWEFDLFEAPMMGSAVAYPATSSDGQIASMSSPASSDRPTRVITEEDRRYDEELQRRAEQEWNNFAQQNGGAQFVGELGSGQMAPAPRDGSGWDSGQGEEAILAYANGIGELVGVAAGFESQIDPMIETIKRHQRVAQYSSDPNERMYSARQAQVWLGTLNGVMEQYKVALGQLFSLYIRDGAIFRDAMRMMGSMPECHPIIRAYCQKFISGSERSSIPQSQPRRNPAPQSFDGEVQQTMREGWLEAIQAGQ